MPKIVLTIETENVSELTTIVAELAGNLDGEIGGGADAPEKPSGRRGRPKKVDAASATSDAGNGEQTSAQGAQGGAGSGPTATTAASPSDFKDQVQQANAQAEEDAAAALLMGGGDAPAVTGDQVATAMRAHLKKHGAEKTQGVLKAQSGASDFKSIPTEKYAAVLAALEAEL